MKAVLEKENKMKIIRIMYVAIIIICIISIIATIWIQQSSTGKPKEPQQLPQVGEEIIEVYKEQFYNMFENKVNYLENNNYKITKINEEKEIIYTGYQNQEKQINNYELDVNIPYINIDNQQTNKFNEQIREIFEKKAKSILNTTDTNTIYTVNYSAYITNNILSLVIRSTLKEGDKAQRDIVQTYNYDILHQKEFLVGDILKNKGITKQQASQKIKSEIKRVQETVENLGELGYNVYPRDYKSDIYSINNVSEYFIGEDDILYIIYAYGNQSYTSEIDIVVM